MSSPGGSKFTPGEKINKYMYIFDTLVNSTANLRLPLIPCIDSLQCPNTHKQMKSNKNTLQGKDPFAMYEAFLFRAGQTIMILHFLVQ